MIARRWWARAALVVAVSSVVLSCRDPQTAMRRSAVDAYLGALCSETTWSGYDAGKGLSEVWEEARPHVCARWRVVLVDSNWPGTNHEYVMEFDEGWGGIVFVDEENGQIRRMHLLVRHRDLGNDVRRWSRE